MPTSDASYLLALRATLESYHIPKSEYSLLEGPKEDAVCLSYRGGQWMTYLFERGQKTCIQYADSLDTAMINMMGELSASRNEQRRMEEYYRRALDNIESKKEN